MTKPQLASAVPGNRDGSAAFQHILLLCLWAVLLLYRPLFFGETFYFGDIALYFRPLYDFFAMAFGEGKLPLWNPFVFCGQPVAANPQSALFYPTTLLYGILPVSKALVISAAFHLALTGTGCYLFLARIQGVSAWGALFGAALFEASGCLLARLQFPTMGQAAAWLPWALLAAQSVLAKPAPARVAGLGVVTGLCLLAGHLQIAYLVLCAVVMLVLVGLWKQREGRLMRLVSCGLGLALGFCVAMPHLLPLSELLPRTSREQLSVWQANRFVFHPQHLANFITPYAYGNPLNGTFWGPGNLWESCVFLGPVPVLLALVAVLQRRSMGAMKAFGFGFAISLWLSMGAYGGLFALAYWVLPGMAAFHDPARFGVLTVFCLCGLAAIEATSQLERWPAIGRALLFTASLVPLWLFAGSATPVAPSAAVESIAKEVEPGGDGRVWTALRQLDWDRQINYDDFGRFGLAAYEGLVRARNSNVQMPFGREEAGGYEPVQLRTMEETERALRRSFDHQLPSLSLLLELLAVDQIELPDGTRSPASARDLRRVGDSVWRPRASANRFWVVPKIHSIRGLRSALLATQSPDFDPSTLAITESLVTLPVIQQPSRVLGWSQNRLGSEIQCRLDGGAGGFLVSSTTAYPGWQAWVDGASVPVVTANAVLMGIPLDPATKDVLFRFEPVSVRLGLFVGLLGVGLAALLIAISGGCREAGKEESAGAAGNLQLEMLHGRPLS